MSNHRIKLIAALCAIAGFAGSTAARANQDTSKPASSLHQSGSAGWSSAQMNDASRGSVHASAGYGVMPASEHSEAKKFDELKGKQVTGSGGENLGQLHDFVIDAKSGKIAHAVVTSGGLLGMGDKLRVVSHDSLKAGEDGLTVQLDKSAFDALPTVDEKELDQGRINAKATSPGQDWQNSSSWTGQRDDAASIDASMKTDSSKTDSSTTADTSSTRADTSDVAAASAPDAADDDAATDGGINVDAGISTGSATASTDVAPSSSTAADTATTPEPTPSVSSSGAVASTSIQPAEVTGAPSTATDANASMHASGDFVLASKLDGKELRSGDEEIGTIEDVAIDLRQGTAMAVVKLKTDAAGGDDLFHVPFSSLQIDSADAQSVSTTLARSDFTQSASSTGISATGTTSASDESLSPTGRTSSTSESYGPTASISTSTSPAEDDADATDAARSTSSSTSIYGSASGSTPATSSSSDPAATAGQTTEPYGATAGSSGSQDAGTSAGISRSPATSGNLSDTTTSSTSPDATTSTSAEPSDFSTTTDSSQSIAGPSSTTAPATTEEEQLTPTGRDAFQDISMVAASIRSQLNGDQNLASEDVRVQEAGKKIMLHGKVSSEDVKERIETLAKQAAGSAEIDSKLKVKEQK